MSVDHLSDLAGADGHRVMMVLDTCYAGHGRSGQQLAAGLRFSVPAYAVQGEAVAQWTAAQPDQLSGPLDEAKHGAFTYWAIGALRGWADGELDGTRDGRVTAEEADAYVQRALRSKGIRDQRPSFTAEGSSGDWVLSEGVDEVGPPL